MKPETADWIARAEGDWRVARREMNAGRPVYNVVCFLAQQCAEKYLKALLEELALPFRKTHDLVVLLETSPDPVPELVLLKPALAHLGTFGMATRYPGAQADRTAALAAVTTAGRVRTVVRGRLRPTRRRRQSAPRLHDR